MDFHHEMRFKYSKEIYPLQRQYGGPPYMGVISIEIQLKIVKAPIKLNIKVEIYVNPEWKMGLK